MIKHTITRVATIVLLFSFSLMYFSTTTAVYAGDGTDDMVFRSCGAGDGTLHTEGNPFCQNVRANQGFELVGPTGLITKIAKIVVWLVGIISVLMIVIGGFKYATSAGDSNGIQSAKNTILYALVGLGVAIFAQLIVSFVLTRLS